MAIWANQQNFNMVFIGLDSSPFSTKFYASEKGNIMIFTPISMHISETNLQSTHPETSSFISVII